MSFCKVQAHKVAMFVALVSIVGCATTGKPTVEEWQPDKRADVHAQLAASYMQRNQLEIARDELNEALRIKPDHSRANYVMAILQTRLNNLGQAEIHYKDAIRSDPENSDAAHSYGIFLCRRGDVKGALTYFHQALSNPLYQGVALSNLRAGECLIATRTDRRRAEPYMREALRINPNLSPALYHMADIQFVRKKYLSARAYIERFFAVSDVTPKSLLLAVQIEKQLGSHDAALSYEKQLKSKFASSDEATQLRTTE